MMQSSKVELFHELLAHEPGTGSAWSHRLSADDVQELLVKGVNSQQLFKISSTILEIRDDLVSPDLRKLVRQVSDSCRSISDQAGAEEADFLEALRALGIRANPCSEKAHPHSLQTHTFAVSIHSDDLIETVDIAKRLGFGLWTPKCPAALECIRRVRSNEVLVKQDEFTIRIEIRWERSASNSETIDRFHPSEPDFAQLNLPRVLWPLYYLIRPARIARRRLLGGNDPAPRWPYLGTPDALIPPLLALARLTDQDHLIDLGCGDGRVLIEAAGRYGCRGLGIEIDETLADLARERVADASLQSQITIKSGDLVALPLNDATVVFIFLPIRSIPSLLKKLREQLPSGSKIIAHEQDPIDPSLKPDQSIPLFTPTAITVAHVWIID